MGEAGGGGSGVSWITNPLSWFSQSSGVISGAVGQQQQQQQEQPLQQQQQQQLLEAIGSSGGYALSLLRSLGDPSFVSASTAPLSSSAAAAAAAAAAAGGAQRRRSRVKIGTRVDGGAFHSDRCADLKNIHKFVLQLNKRAAIKQQGINLTDENSGVCTPEDDPIQCGGIIAFNRIPIHLKNNNEKLTVVESPVSGMQTLNP